MSLALTCAPLKNAAFNAGKGLNMSASKAENKPVVPKLSRTEKLAQKRRELEEQQLKDWLELQKTWAERASKVLAFFMEERPHVYKTNVNPTPKYKGHVAMRFENIEQDWDEHLLYLSFPLEAQDSDDRWAIEEALLLLERRMDSIAEALREERRKIEVKAAALKKAKEVFTSEELELMGIRN